MSKKIISKLTNKKYREGWDKAFSEKFSDKPLTAERIKKAIDDITKGKTGEMVSAVADGDYVYNAGSKGNEIAVLIDDTTIAAIVEEKEGKDEYDAYG